jgi:hypothetical protein
MPDPDRSPLVFGAGLGYQRAVQPRFVSAFFVLVAGSVPACADAPLGEATDAASDIGPVPDVPWSRDASTGPGDALRPSRDAPLYTEDAHVSPWTDLGAADPDAASLDAAQPIPDAGQPIPDAGAPDAARPLPDAARPLPDAAPPDVAPPLPDATAPDAGCSPVEAPCDRTLYQSARDYAAAHPQRDGATWHLWCGSLMWRFGGLAEANARPTAIEAYRDSEILGADDAQAPQGALHWWDIGEDGHVGLDVQGGGHTVFMATRHLREVWGDAIGVNGVPAYSAETGARYLGWSLDYAGGRFPSMGVPACEAPPVVPEGCDVAPTATARTGETDLDFWRRMQRFARAHAYDGPVNGLMDRPSWAGVQRGLRVAGYEGPDDGLPGVNTFRAMQRIAAQYGYMGPVDGILGPNSYRGFAAFLNAEY